MPAPENDTRAIVHQLLGRAGLSPLPDEVDQLVEAYESNREELAGIYALTGVRYEEPALVFDPRQA